MTQSVKVRLRKPLRVHTAIVKNIEITRNEGCIVRTDRGLEYAVCVVTPEDCTEEEEKRFSFNIVRRATHHDSVTWGQIKDDEYRAVRMCREKIRDRKLPMKLVECEYSFDRKKVIFYFTAEDRVDFRELVKDLAQDLRTRIELRHIQVRDEAKIVGGIGTCGRELCCTTWMTEFMPISMRMAKRQNLSLNPIKISGQCGRLMCCLSYENDLYDKKKKAIIFEAEPKDLADIRDEMEIHVAGAVETLSSGTMKGVLESPEPLVLPKSDQAESSSEGRREQRSRGPRRRPDRRPDRKTESRGSQEKSSDGASGASTEKSAPKEGAAPKKRRRRRRRGGQGGGQGGGQSGQGSQGGQGTQN